MALDAGQIVLGLGAIGGATMAIIKVAELWFAKAAKHECTAAPEFAKIYSRVDRNEQRIGDAHDAIREARNEARQDRAGIYEAISELSKAVNQLIGKYEATTKKES